VIVSLVVAMARNGVIGRDNTLPWHLPADLRHFKSVTWGKPILMGRKTFQSIGRALPGRTNLVLTRDPHWRADGVVVLHSVSAALAQIGAAPELAVIGGADIFRLLLPQATRIHLTRIEAEIAGDTSFPAIDPAQWVERDRHECPADERNAYAMTFMTLERAPAGAR